MSKTVEIARNPEQQGSTIRHRTPIDGSASSIVFSYPRTGADATAPSRVLLTRYDANPTLGPLPLIRSVSPERMQQLEDARTRYDGGREALAALTLPGAVDYAKLREGADSLLVQQQGEAMRTAVICDGPRLGRQEKQLYFDPIVTEAVNAKQALEKLTEQAGSAGYDFVKKLLFAENDRLITLGFILANGYITLPDDIVERASAISSDTTMPVDTRAHAKNVSRGRDTFGTQGVEHPRDNYFSN